MLPEITPRKIPTTSRTGPTADLLPYLSRPMTPPSEDVQIAIERGPIALADALLRTQLDRLLDPVPLPAETGWCTLDDGSGYVAVRHSDAGCHQRDGRMVVYMERSRSDPLSGLVSRCLRLDPRRRKGRSSASETPLGSCQLSGRGYRTWYEQSPHRVHPAVTARLLDRRHRRPSVSGRSSRAWSVTSPSTCSTRS
jgi:hypothetical protein